MSINTVHYCPQLPTKLHCKSRLLCPIQLAHNLITTLYSSAIFVTPPHNAHSPPPNLACSRQISMTYFQQRASLLLEVLSHTCRQLSTAYTCMEGGANLARCGQSEKCVYVTCLLLLSITIYSCIINHQQIIKIIFTRKYCSFFHSASFQWIAISLYNVVVLYSEQQVLFHVQLNSGNCSLSYYVSSKWIDRQQQQ